MGSAGNGSVGFNGAAAFWPRRYATQSGACRGNECFNGAAAFWPRRCEIDAWLEHLARRFNGAAAFWPRRSSLRLGLTARQVRLQRGRGFLAAEITSCASPNEPPRASTGPRLFGRGDPTWASRSALRSGASTGPRLFGRGDSMPRIRFFPLTRLLQRGRGFLAAEIFRQSH